MQAPAIHQSSAVNQLTISQIKPLLTDSLTKIKHFSDTSLAILGKEPKPAPLPNQGNTTYYIFRHYERPSAFQSFCRIFSGPSTVININSNNFSAPAAPPPRSQMQDRDNEDRRSNSKDDTTTKVAIALLAFIGLGVGLWAKGQNDAAQENQVDVEGVVNLYSQRHKQAVQLGMTAACPDLTNVNTLANQLIQKYQKQLRNRNILYTIVIISSAVLLAGVIFENPMARLRNFGWVGMIGSGGYYIYMMGSEGNTKQQLRSIANSLNTSIQNAHAQLNLAFPDQHVPHFNINDNLPPAYEPSAPPPYAPLDPLANSKHSSIF